LAFKAALWSRSISRTVEHIGLSSLGSGGRLDQDWCLLALHAFTLTNVVGEQTRVKDKLIPQAGQFGLGAHEAR
jgi:hypothetical protein